jgi:transketolase
MKRSLRETFTDTVCEVGLRDEKLLVLVSDISHGRFSPFFKERPKQYYNVGVCENTVINMGSGLSALGFYPVMHTFSTFLLERSYEQIKLGFGYQQLGGNILVIGSGIDYPCHGSTHHSYADYGLMKTIDGSEFVFPVTDIEFNLLFKQTYNNGKITIFRIPQYAHDIDFAAHDIVFGKGILVREGQDMTIVVLGEPLQTAMNSVEQLRQIGVSPEIIYINTVKPLDVELIQSSLSKTKHCLVIEEHSMYGSVFDDVLRCTKDMDGIRYRSINLGDKFVHEYGTYKQHHQRLGFSVEGILQKTRELFER